jgi:transposase InsO family protein
MEDNMEESLVIASLRSSIALRQPLPGLIHHSDRGGQYAGAEYRLIQTRAGMLSSMNRAANCYDNAFMESCIGTVKRELEMTDYASGLTARKEIGEYLVYYNTERMHSAIGYLTPVEFERKHREMSQPKRKAK